MRAAIIKDGRVWNLVEVDSLQHPEFQLVECGPQVNIGDAYDGTMFSRPGLAPEVLMADIAARTQARLDAFAATRSYGDERTAPIVSACSYAASTHPRYGPEGRYCLQAREQTWDVLWSILAAVQAGTRPAPASYEEIEPELPVLAWPV